MEPSPARGSRPRHGSAARGEALGAVEEQLADVLDVVRPGTRVLAAELVVVCGARQRGRPGREGIGRGGLVGRADSVRIRIREEVRIRGRFVAKPEPSQCSRSSAEQRFERRHEVIDLQRLREVPMEAGIQPMLLVGFGGRSGQGDHGNTHRLGDRAQRSSASNPFIPGRLMSIKDDVWLARSGDLHTLFGGASREQFDVFAGAEEVLDEGNVGWVVLDVQDRLATVPGTKPAPALHAAGGALDAVFDAGTGMSTQNSEPSVDELLQPTSPFMILASRFVMNSPIPVPSTGPVSCPAL